MEPDRPLNLIESYDLDDPSLDREQIECESPVMFSSYSHSEDSIENWEAGTAEFHSGSDHQPNATTRPVLGAGPRELDLCINGKNQAAYRMLQLSKTINEVKKD
jgi:hypothetical protein